MARGRQKRYQEYRGRRSRGSLVLKIIAVLLALILVAGVVFVVFLNGRVEYTDEGVRLILPWNSSEPTPSPMPSGSAPPPVIITDEPSPSPSEEPAEELLAIGAVSVTTAQLLDGTALQAVSAAGGNALVVEMKNEYGRLSWRSSSDMATALGVNAADDRVARAVSALAEETELYLVARVVCFRDQALAGAGVGGPLTTLGGNIWYDRYGLRWVSPVDGTVTGYLIELCLELAEMGFDEILLDCAGYPDFGETHVLATNTLRPEDLSVPVGGFLASVREALASSGTALSVLTKDGMLTGTDLNSGITAGLLADCTDRVWIAPPNTEGTDYVALLEQAGMENASARLVSLGGVTTEGSWTTAE